MKEIRVSVPVESIRSLAKSLESTKFRRGRIPQGELTSKESVLKLGNNSWYAFKNLSIEMDFIPDNVYMKTGDLYQNLNTGECVRLKNTRNKFLQKTPIGFQNFDIKTLTTSDRLILASTQNCLNEVLSDHNTKLTNPKADFESVVAAAYQILNSYPYHNHDVFLSMDNTATAVSCVARDVVGRNIGFKSSHWASEAKKVSASQRAMNYELGFNEVMESKTLADEFKTEFLSYRDKKYLDLEQIDKLCEVMESALMNSGLKIENNYDNKIVGVVGEQSNKIVGKCMGYHTERKGNGGAEYVILVRTENNTCVRLRSGAPYSKKMLVDAFNNDKELEFTGVVLSQTPAKSYDSFTPSLREKLCRPAITDISVSPSNLAIKEDFKNTLELKERRTMSM